MTANMPYACDCGRPIRAEFVEGILPGGMVSNAQTVLVSYFCECDYPDEDPWVCRYIYVGKVVKALSGEKTIPYRNPYVLRPVPNDAEELVEFRQDLAHVETVEDFEALANGE